MPSDHSSFEELWRGIEELDPEHAEPTAAAMKRMKTGMVKLTALLVI